MHLTHVIPFPCFFSVVSEAFPQFGGKTELRMLADPPGPIGGRAGRPCAIEGGVDFNRIEVTSEISEGVKASGG